MAKKKVNEHGLTEKQAVFMLETTRTGEYHGLKDPIRVDHLTESLMDRGIMNKMQSGAMITTLVEKGLATVTEGTYDNDLTGRTKKGRFLTFTADGTKILIQMTADTEPITIGPRKKGRPRKVV